MIRNRRLLRGVAVLFIFELLFNTISPAVSWALTSGPTAPEASSFEPVDTTDMVNLVTGDFTYNLPLLDVPGPSGGYPLSLSYHAGIQPLVDASWVGLGFTLNPGALNRSINGFADDFNGITDTDRVFWEGGSTTTYTVGLSVGYTGTPHVMAGLTFSEDTYKGFGVGHYYGVSVGANWGPVSMGISHVQGVGPFGGSFASTGFGIGISATSNNLSASANLSVSFDQDGNISTGASVGLSYSVNENMSLSLMDASISSTGGGISKSFGGYAKSVNNSKAGRISTDGYDHQIDIPTPWAFSIRLGKSYQRYWMDEIENVATNGSLYFPTTLPTTAELDNKAYDVYDLSSINKPVSANIPDESFVGSFVDYDSYQVLGQGISGSIRPFHYTSYLLRQNRAADNNGTEEYQVKSYPLAVNKKPHFRFEGDFSNRYVHSTDNDKFNTTSPSTPPMSFSFDPNRTTGESGNDGYDAAKNVLPGSKRVEYFTNKQIRDKGTSSTNAKNNGFIDCQAIGFTRADDDKIGGFKITNSSGVNYHYGLPVYSSNEHTFSGRQDEQNKWQFNTTKKLEPYAYTWFLTALTGPDYYDTNSNGYADAGDFGYWVSFDYGKWTDNFKWRNPGVGFGKDIDQNYNNFSKGTKQLYYLNAIRTETHTAVFVKELRYDGKGVVHKLNEAVTVNAVLKSVTAIDDGSYDTYNNEFAVSPLRLNSIYLIQNKDFAGYSAANIANVGSTYFHYTDPACCTGKWTMGRNVIDIYDVQNTTVGNVLKTKCLKKIEFVTDYSLSPGTANSYKSALDVLNTAETASATKMGKLTLKALRVLGRAEAALLPDIKFSYGKEEPILGQFTTSGGTRRVFIPHLSTYNFKIGEILKYERNGRWYYWYVTKVNATDLDVAQVVSSQPDYNSLTSTTDFIRTKNPPFSENHYDLWGFYKVDYSDFEGKSENEKRMVTSISAGAMDAWSLTEVKTSLGAKIQVDYEPDQYRNTLKSLSNIPIRSIALSNGDTKVTLFEKLSEYGLATGDQIKMRFMHAMRYNIVNASEYTGLRFHCDDDDHTYTYNWRYDDLFNSSYGITVTSDNSFTIDYDFTGRFPSTNAGLCMNENFPYELRDGSGDYNCIALNFLTKEAPIFLGGEVLSSKPFSPYGGGLRVKRLSLKDPERTRSTNYSYENGVTSYEPLGYAMPINKLPANLLYKCLETIQNDEITKYRDAFIPDVYQKFQFLFANARELPAPGALYERVTVSETINRNGAITQVPGRSEYLFENFTPETIDVSNSGHLNIVTAFKNQYSTNSSFQPPSNYSGPNVLGLKVTRIETGNRATINDYSAIMGSLRKITLFDNNGQKITETVNEFLHDNFSTTEFKNKLSAFKDQGVITETFADARLVIQPNQTTTPKAYTLGGLVSQKVRYPSVQVAQTSINYKTGVKTRTQNLGFDYYSGQQTKTLTNDGAGNYFLIEKIPAYRKYPSMGLSLTYGINMLTQEAGSVTYRVDPANVNTVLGVVAASVQTWSDGVKSVRPGDYYNPTTQLGIWRKQSIYDYQGETGIAVANDGTYPLANFKAFTAWNSGETVPDGWKKSAEVKLYNVYSQALEAADMNGNSAATMMSIDQRQILATASIGAHTELAYSSFEETPTAAGYFSGYINRVGGVKDGGRKHTGTSSLRIGANQSGASVAMLTKPFPARKSFRVSMWIHQVNVSSTQLNYSFYTAGAPTSTTMVSAGVLPVVANPEKQSGEWYLVDLDVPVPSATSPNLTMNLSVVNSGTANIYVDDVRIAPYDAVVYSYLYNEWGDIWYVMDNDNLYKRFTYDAQGRLTATYTETLKIGEKKVNEVKYSYANQ